MFFRKNKKKYEFLETNFEVLETKKQKIAERMYHFKSDPCMDDFRELIRVGKALAVLDCSVSKNGDDLIRRQAKLEMFDELSMFVERWVNERPKQKDTEENKKPRGTLRTIRSVNNQAGSAF